ncbi:MAG: phenylalanine--tRNA ligase subunit beta [Phycisphaerae bacterium]|mgnify:CR=1 FL=1|nr:phenylalanine--tRNA ligase subunit beta [Phycisphaerae bacterium]
MRTSVTWLNDYLDPPATADEQGELLTNAGFPIDGKDVASNGEPWQEIEITSNRGDCLAHIGFAREICAVSGRRLRWTTPVIEATGPEARSIITVTNSNTELCPLYTARVIRGVTIKPSPEWLQRRLIAIGQIPRNNVVDATNFVLFELGQPTHVFDLALLTGNELRVRMAKADEPFLPIGDGAAEVKLRETDLVIADRDKAVAIAGVKGGALTAVTDATRDIVIEAAAFSPVAVRATSRALRISSDSSYRFERGVHPAEVAAASDRLVQLILETAGGELCAGSVSDGAPLAASRTVTMRASRCRQLLGIEIPIETIMARLAGLGFDPEPLDDDRITCTVPARRIDVEREIDLIEEICRTHGLQHIPVAETMPIRVVPVQPAVAGARATKDLLVGLGCVECVTHTLVSDSAAAAFLSGGRSTLLVDDERAGGEPTLRPSILPSLLRVRRHNLDNGLAHLDLFEASSTFHLERSKHVETAVIAMTFDAAGNGPADRDDCYRRCRGTVERIAVLLCGPASVVEVVPAGPDAGHAPWLAPGGRVRIDGRDVGSMGLLAPAVMKQFGLERPIVAAELALGELFQRYPPDTSAAAMPAFPAIERDISAIVDERVQWADVVGLIRGLTLSQLESLAHVATYRGKQVGAGKKSVTMRLVFRSTSRTLRSEEVDAPVALAIEALRTTLSAEVRTT